MNPRRVRIRQTLEVEQGAGDQVGEPLYLGRRRNSYVEGLSQAESDALLDALWAHIERPDLRYQHRWRVGDLLLWDNRSTMHRRDPLDSATRRVMHRTQIKGHERVT